MATILKNIPASPFVDQRKGREDPSTEIYVNYEDYCYWASNKNCLIQGTRGTGKTSILNIFDYKTRWFNNGLIKPAENLKSLFPDQPDLIGICYKCEELEKSLWAKWSKRFIFEDDLTDSEIVFGIFINYYFLEKIIGGLFEIKEKFDWIIDENDNLPLLISEIYNECYPVKDKKPSLYDHSLSSLKYQLYETHFSLREQIFSLVSPIDIKERFNIHSATSGIIERVCKIIQNRLPKFKKIKFFLLFDDIDRLDSWQLKVINSIISSSNEPCSIKMTCTNDYLIKTSTNDRVTGNTDLFISKLNDDRETSGKKGNKRIDELFNAIFNIRISKCIENKIIYSIEEVFGADRDIDDLLIASLKKSIGNEVKILLDGYKISGNTKLTDYWLDKNKLSKAFKNVAYKRKKYDQYRISAVFAILNYYNIIESIEYSSYSIIKMISSGSPRHFLRICDRMWSSIYSALKNNKFPIKDSAQSKAIKTASEDVFQNIEDDPSDKIMCERLVDLFKKLLSVESMRVTPECLSVETDMAKFNENELKRFIKIIDRLLIVEAVKIRGELNASTKIKIALNPMLAPKFCLPYRSPFSYSFTIEKPLILLDYLTCDENNKKKTLNRIYFDRIGIKQDPILFEDS